MTIVAVCSTRSSPGVTSLCVALGAAWARFGVRPLLIEADPSGGVIGLRFAMTADPSLRTLWADMRRSFSPELLMRNSSDLRGVDCLLAPTDPLLASRALDHVAPVLAHELAMLNRPVVIDLGRIEHASVALPFVRCATQVLVVTKPKVEDVQSLLYGSRLLEANGATPAIVSIGDGPHHPAEVASLSGLALAAVLPDDPRVASAFCGGRYRARKLAKSTLWRCLDALANELWMPTHSAPVATAEPAANAVHTTLEHSATQPHTSQAPPRRPVPPRPPAPLHAPAMRQPSTPPRPTSTRRGSPPDDADITEPRPERDQLVRGAAR